MIYVECKPDFTLVQALTTLPKREIAHELKGKYGIASRLNSRTSVRAMVDEDPGKHQPSYLIEMQTLQDLPLHGLRVLEDSSRSNLAVVIRPQLEDWVLRTARDAGVDLTHSRYNLPNDPKKLHEVINFDMRKFERLVQDLLTTPRFQSLQQLLNL